MKMMKLTLAALLGSAAAFAPAGSKSSSSSAVNAFAKNWQDSFTINNLPGALPPLDVWDPLGFASKADEKTLKRYREAEITHGRVASEYICA